MATSTLSAEERNSRAIALLRQVDEDVKEKRFDQALDKIRKVYEYDIRNIYARAYEERVLVMMMEQGREETLREANRNVGEKIDQEVKRRLREFYRQQEIDSQKRKQDEKTEQALEERARQASVNEVRHETTGGVSHIEKETTERIEALEKNLMTKDPSAGGKTSEQLADIEAQRKKIQEEAFNKLKQEQQHAQAELVQHMENERTAAIHREQEKAKQRELEAYKSLMILMNKLSVSADIQTSVLQSLKISFSISDAEHTTAEREVQVNAYIEAVRTVWKSGKPSDVDTEQLKRLQNFYHISEDEHASILRRVKKELAVPDENAVIIVVDDDLAIRKYVEHILRKTYNTVIIVSSAENALPELEKVVPSLIISDINLGTGVMSGFTFYEKLKNGSLGESLKNVPFILMSSMEDEFFVKSAKQMGVRAFMSKPFTRETLEMLVKKTLG